MPLYYFAILVPLIYICHFTSIYLRKRSSFSNRSNWYFYYCKLASILVIAWILFELIFIGNRI